MAQARLFSDGVGQRVREPARAVVEPLPHCGEELLLRHAGGQMVDRYDAPGDGVGTVLQLKDGVCHRAVRAVEGDLAEEDVAAAALDAVSQIALVEVGDVRRAAVVDDAETDKLHAAPDARERRLGGDEGVDADGRVRRGERDRHGL